MADRRKGRKKKEPELKDGEPKPSKEEYAVAKYMRKHLPEKKTTLLGHKVDYFISSKAIDCLLDSPWATKTGKTDVLFTTRESVVEFMDRMLEHKFFHRAKKIVVQKDGKKKKKDEESAESSKEKEVKKIKRKNESEEKEVKKTKGKNECEEKDPKKLKGKNESEEKKGRGKNEVERKHDEKKDDGSTKKKEKKKIKLDIHMKQIFSDGNEAYVWIYDPIPVHTWIIGTLMVIGAVLVCLFPLWPRTIRHYIYYLSIAAAGFLVFLIVLAVVRLVVFVVIWLVTFGKHHVWLLPNLTEDVGFFESFWPLYHYEYKGSKDKITKEEEKSKDSTNVENKENEKSDSSSDQEGKLDQVHSESEQESEGEKLKVNNEENGFEIVDAEDMNHCEVEKKEDSADD